MKVKVSKLIALFLTAVMILASFTVLGDEATKPIRERVKAAAMVKAGPKLTDEQKAEMKAKRLEALKENLDKRVAEGKLTQEQADEIYANAEEGKFPFGKREPLTEEQKAEMKAKRLETLKENLDKRVAEGKLTQEQADEIYAKAEEGKFPPVRMHKERKPLTEEQKAEMKAKRLETLKENLDKRVAEGKLTQEQADEIYAKAEEGKFPPVRIRKGREPLTEEQKAEMKAKRLETLKENLDKRVAEGKLTQEQADEIYAKAEEGKFPPVRMHKERKPLTEEQKAEMKSKTGERVKGGKGPMKKIGPRNGGMIRPKKAALEKATALKV